MEINILGYGLMAKQIAALFYLGGHDVTIWNRRQVEEKDLLWQAKLINRHLRSDIQGSYNITTSMEMLEDNLTIESVIENIDVKRMLYEQMKNKITKGYLSNTSSYSPSEIGDAVGGLHFFNPIYLKIVEVCLPVRVSSDLHTLLEFLREKTFEVIEVQPNRGYVGNFILFNEISSVLKLIEQYGYSIDTVLKMYNRLYEGRDIFNIIDIIGIDVVQIILANLNQKDNSIYIPRCLEEAMRRNILGKKNKTTIRQLFID